MKKYETKRLEVLMMPEYIILRGDFGEKTYSRKFYRYLLLAGDKAVLVDNYGEPHRVFTFEKIYWSVEICVMEF